MQGSGASDSQAVSLAEGDNRDGQQAAAGTRRRRRHPTPARVPLPVFPSIPSLSSLWLVSSAVDPGDEINASASVAMRVRWEALTLVSAVGGTAPEHWEKPLQFANKWFCLDKCCNFLCSLAHANYSVEKVSDDLVCRQDGCHFRHQNVCSLSLCARENVSFEIEANLTSTQQRKIPVYGYMLEYLIAFDGSEEVNKARA